jgi:hypothetical protein
MQERTLNILSLFPCFLWSDKAPTAIVRDFSENTENPSNNTKTGIMVTTSIYTNLYIIIAKRVPVYQLPATTRYRTGVKNKLLKIFCDSKILHQQKDFDNRPMEKSRSYGQGIRFPAMPAGVQTLKIRKIIL